VIGSSSRGLPSSSVLRFFSEASQSVFFEFQNELNFELRDFELVVVVDFQYYFGVDDD
jgi:hypothetical protein